MLRRHDHDTPLCGRCEYIQGLPPEYQSYWIKALYDSGEELSFTIAGYLSYPWCLDLRKALCDELVRHGIEDMLPPKADRKVARFLLEIHKWPLLIRYWTIRTDEAPEERVVHDLKAFLDREIDGRKRLQDLPADYIDFLRVCNGLYISAPKAKKDRKFRLFRKHNSPERIVVFYGTVKLQDCPYNRDADLFTMNHFKMEYPDCEDHDLIRLGGHLYDDQRFGYYEPIDFYYYDPEKKNYLFIKQCLRDDSFYDKYVPPLQFASLPEMLEHALSFFRKE